MALALLLAFDLASTTSDYAALDELLRLLGATRISRSTWVVAEADGRSAAQLETLLRRTVEPHDQVCVEDMTGKAGERLVDTILRFEGGPTSSHEPREVPGEKVGRLSRHLRDTDT